jgi:phosphoglycolate phosphatase-like HAD superfamily hydrolase
MDSKDAVKLFVFDFDLTISCIHVFKTLSGWDKKGALVEPPHCMTEVGQIARIQELDKKPNFQSNGGFSKMVLGGDERLNALRTLFKELKASGAELILCTKGLVGAVNKILEDTNLADCFSMVYGRSGSTYGHTSYDKAAAQEKDANRKRLCSTEDQSEWTSKDVLCDTLMQEKGLKWEECILVEDDPDETEAAEGVCRTMLVDDSVGMQKDDMVALVNLARGLGDKSTENAGVISDFTILPVSVWKDEKPKACDAAKAEGGALAKKDSVRDGPAERDCCAIL